MGTKAVARETVEAAGVPIVPDTDGIIEDIDEAVSTARSIGYSVFAGGGGKGMRVAESEEGLKKAISMAQQEAETAFGNAGVYLEKHIEEPRHIEIQIIGLINYLVGRISNHCQR